MTELLDRYRDLQEQAAALASDALAAGGVRALSDDDAAALLAFAAAVSRSADAVAVEIVGDLHMRDLEHPRAEQITTKHGCRNLREFVARITRVSGRRAGEYVTAGRAIQQQPALGGAGVCQAQFPAMRDALADSIVGLDGLLAVTTVLGDALPSGTDRLPADEELAASARGEGSEQGPPPSADELRMQAHVWAMYLHPDGAEPREAAAERKRGVVLGVCRDGLVPVRGNLLPEVAAQYERLRDAILNPKLSGPNFTAGDPDGDTGVSPDASEGLPPQSVADTRSQAQRMHDVLATILIAAAGSGEVPTLGGAAPTLVVSATAEDLRRGAGFAHIDGLDEPLSLSVARHAACAGAIQRLWQADNGRIEEICTLERIFNVHQRRAIGLRDGECIIPGCHVPAAWCEVHHVVEHSRGGPTSTDNGVLLCWHHHRTIDFSGWRIRMVDGIPEVLGPNWWDPYGRWRAVTKSPIMRRRRHDRRLALAPPG